MTARACILACALAGLVGCEARPPIKVGVLHSLSGTMAVSGQSARDGTLLAIEELNSKGGLLGRVIEPVVADGTSDWPTFAAEAERLITEEKVSVIFGCWTSSSRKAVRPVVEKHGHLLVYPVQYEGLEQSPNILYTGATANQQLVPAVKWCRDQGWRRFFLVGSDYVFPRAANEILRRHITALRGEVAGEEYLLLGSRDVDAVVHRIAAARPDVILNTINGDTNAAFFAALRRAGVTPERTPTVSFSVAEPELAAWDGPDFTGDYAVWSYFQSLDTPENRAFVDRFRARFGAGRVTSDPVESAWFGVHLWAQAVLDAGSADPAAVRAELGGQSFLAPEGIVSIDSETLHTWRPVRVGRARSDGQFDVVWDTGRAVRPIPYPRWRSRPQWDACLDDLFRRWGGHWANVGGGAAPPPGPAAERRSP